MAADFEADGERRRPFWLLRSLLGDKAVAVIRFDTDREGRDITKAIGVFPEAEVSRRLYTPFDSPGQVIRGAKRSN